MIRKFILGLLFFCLAIQANASHLVGADMSYTSLGSGKYKITLKVYRDCRGVKLGTINLEAFAGDNGGNTCGTVKLNTFSSVKVSDITNNCPNSAKPCNPSNTSGSGRGIEEHVLEQIVDFGVAPLKNFVNNYSCCEVTFSANECCRSGSITTGSAGSDFYITCSINLCNLKLTNKSVNTSPQWVYNPIVQACCNVPYYGANDIGDTVDFDSITFSLFAPIQALPYLGVNYTSPFSSRYPLTPFCIPPTSIKCTPDPTLETPKGFYFDTITGDFVFTPTKCDEVPVISFEQKEWRKDITTEEWLCIGRTHREIQIWVNTNCASNIPPRILGERKMSVCAGKKICHTITVLDKTVSPLQTVADTPTIVWNANFTGAVFNVVDSLEREKEVYFCWQTKLSDAADVAYGFSITANDSQCNPNLPSIANFKVKVIDCSKSEVKNVKSKLHSERIIPNPTSGLFAIVLQKEISHTQVVVCDLAGRKIYAKTFNDSKELLMDLQLPSGIYFANFQIDNQLRSLKFVIK
jgi:hypothetical protein